MRSYLSKNILGIPIAAVSLAKIPHTIISHIEKKGKKAFFYVNAHCLDLANRDREYKRILQRATFVYSGGFGPILASQLLGVSLPGRSPTPDFIEHVFAIAQNKGWSFFLLGGEKGVVQKTAAKLAQKFPNLKIAGFHHGYFTDNDKIVAKINRVKPTIILVGMGSLKQEKWIAKNMDKIDAHIFWAVGALFDILSGRIRRAPFWMQRMALEWLWRLIQEPRRLWKRYLIGNIRFIILILKYRINF